VPLGDTPTFMTLSPDGRWGYLLDERSGHLSRMDLSSGRSAARVRLGFRPQHATFLERQNLLAVSLPLAQKVVLLDPLSLQQVRAIATGSEPAGLLVFDQLLYIAESGDHSVAIVDLPGQREVGRVTVGLAPSRLVESDRIIYVSNTEDGSLSVLIPGQLGVVRDVRGLDRPREMAFNRFYRRLYVADEMARALVVVDVNSNLIVGRIALGARPTGMAVTP
jgi:DNA-binding beta-propeller fold protein YncE